MNWWLIIVAAIVGGVVGAAIMAACCAAGSVDQTQEMIRLRVALGRLARIVGGDQSVDVDAALWEAHGALGYKRDWETGEVDNARPI